MMLHTSGANKVVVNLAQMLYLMEAGDKDVTHIYPWLALSLYVRRADLAATLIMAARATRGDVFMFGLTPEAASKALEGVFDLHGLRALMNGGEEPDVLSALASQLDAGRVDARKAWEQNDDTSTTELQGNVGQDVRTEGVRGSDGEVAGGPEGTGVPVHEDRAQSAGPVPRRGTDEFGLDARHGPPASRVVADDGTGSPQGRGGDTANHPVADVDRRLAADERRRTWKDYQRVKGTDRERDAYAAWEAARDEAARLEHEWRQAQCAAG